jgi:predicted HicB family RNase H-like nuclease
MAEDAIEAYIESLKKHGEEIPQPLAEKSFSGNIPLRVEPALHRKLAIEANFKNNRLNQLIAEKLKAS